MKKITGSLLLVLLIVGVLAGWASPGHAFSVPALNITGGWVDSESNGRFHRILDRLLDQDGVVKMGEYQPIGDIVPSITRGGDRFSLFTSGFNGAPSPFATIVTSPPVGSVVRSYIVADLSSLFFAMNDGDSFRLWNIGNIGGRLATGTFNPETLEFRLSWENSLPGALWRHGRPATFNLEGTVVPIPPTLALYAAGLLGLVSYGWLMRRFGN
jgi:hypothetical protein